MILNKNKHYININSFSLIQIALKGKFSLKNDLEYVYVLHLNSAKKQPFK